MTFTSSKSYTFHLFGIDLQFGTSTHETAIQRWTKTASSITYTKQQRDVPSYKEFDWFAIGY